MNTIATGFTQQQFICQRINESTSEKNIYALIQALNVFIHNSKYMFATEMEPFNIYINLFSASV